uniref:BLE2 protein n=1 Tax=Hordeum vulgare subsp. vulgare TaxID=112509 RepID=A0A8I6XAL7_HORVV
MVILVIGTVLFPETAIPPMCNPLRHTLSLWSPVVATLLLCPSVPYRVDDESIIARISFSTPKLTVYLVLFVVVLLLTVSRLQFPAIVKLVDWALGNKIVFWRRVIMNLCMLVAIVMPIFTFHGIARMVMIIFDIFVVMIASFGNLQIPAAVLRIVLALWSLRVILPYVHGDLENVDQNNLGEQKNLVKSLVIFFVMVLGQGILYIVGGILEIFSFILRRSLTRHAGFRGPQGLEYVNLYYAYVFDKCMKGAVLAPEKTSLITFAVDSLNSGSPKKQLYGLKMLHIFLEKDPLKTKAISELTTSIETMTCLINMLGWTSEGDKDIRLFAAKELKDPLLDGSPKAKQDSLIQQVNRNGQTSPMLKRLKELSKYCLIPRKEPTNMDEQNSHVLRCWKRITKRWSVPEEEPSTDQDILPLLGMLILDKLASFDLENCIEISRATGLISKIIEFTSSRTEMTNINETQQALLKGSSLELLRRFSSTKGEFGVILRQKVSENLFLLNHLADILDDSGSSQELRELTSELLRNLAMVGNTKEEIGQIRVIISRLMHAFLSQDALSSTDSGQRLRMKSGQALTVLAMESADNCYVMLEEPGYAFIKELTLMIHSDRYRYVASILLRNMCVHARPKLCSSDLKEISYIVREVLEGIMDAEGTELEVLVGLSSQICKATPDGFARELEHGQIKEAFVKRLVDALNSNMIPNAHCPGIRRAIVEHAIYMMESNTVYTSCFKNCRMMEALLMVERTPSRTEKYRFFSGDAGLMEHSILLSTLVAEAKELMGRE